MDSSRFSTTESGLKSIAIPTPDLIGSSSMVTRTNIVSPSSSSSSSTSLTMGNEEEEEERDMIRLRSRSGKWREYPPPIHYLVSRTENVPCGPCQMPWALERTYEKDGRLVIKEVMVKQHHEHFKVMRSNGRLTLKLVHFDSEKYQLERKNSMVQVVDNVVDNDNVDDHPRHVHHGLRRKSSSSSSLSSTTMLNDDEFDIGVEDDKEDISEISEEEGKEDEEKEGLVIEKRRHKVEMKVKRETMVLASSMPEGKSMGCLPKESRARILRMPIPTQIH